LKILHINYSDNIGGAAKSAYRLHKELIKNNINSEMFVIQKDSDSFLIKSPEGLLTKLWFKVLPHIGRFTKKIVNYDKNIPQNFGIFPSPLKKIINKSNADIVHIHWIGGEMLPISAIAKINKPVVWTFHDMWAFCSSEHISYDNNYVNGYIYPSVVLKVLNCNLSRYIWNKKRKSWKKSFTIISPSAWMQRKALKSPLFHDFSIYKIHNLLDLNFWKPIEKKYAREIVGLPYDKKIILYGAVGGTKDQNKGFSYLISALNKINNKSQRKITLALFGESEFNSKESNKLPIEVFHLGKVIDDITLKIIYSASDVLALPSKLENLPNVAIEAMSCGVPVVAFNVGGILDVVQDKKTGFLIEKYNTKKFAESIEQLISDNSLYQKFSSHCIEHITRKFSCKTIIQEHKDLYKKICK